MNSRFCRTGIIAKFDSFSNIFLTMIIKTIEFMFAGINMFWARLRLLLSQAVRGGWKWALISAQNIFMFKNIHTINWGHWESKNWKKITTKQSEEYFFQQCCEEMSTNTAMASGFWLAALYIVWLIFDSCFSLVYFSRLKYILASQILHFSP